MMAGTDANPPTDSPDATADEARPGLPGLRSWRAVYAVVLILFAAYVLLLTALSRAFA